MAQVWIYAFPAESVQKQILTIIPLNNGCTPYSTCLKTGAIFLLLKRLSAHTKS
jgi:hypothetical protein